MSVSVSISVSGSASVTLSICMFVQPIPLGEKFLKAQSSKLKAQSSKVEHLFCHVSVKSDIRAVSFEL